MSSPDNCCFLEPETCVTPIFTQSGGPTVIATYPSDIDVQESPNSWTADGGTRTNTSVVPLGGGQALLTFTGLTPPITIEVTAGQGGAIIQLDPEFLTCEGTYQVQS